MPQTAPQQVFAANFPQPTPPNQIPYDMPKPSVGQTVLWYANASSSTKPMPCVVAEVYYRHVRLLSLDASQPYLGDKIRHSGDPALMLPAERQNGCWAYTIEYVDRMNWQQKVEGHIAKLAAAFDLELEPKPVEEVIDEATKAKNLAELEAALGQDEQEDE